MLRCLHLYTNRPLSAYSCHLSTLALTQYFCCVLVLSNGASQVSENSWNYWLRQWLEYMNFSLLQPWPSRQMHIAVPLYKTSTKEISAIEDNNQLRPSWQVCCLIWYFERHVPYNFCAISACNLTDSWLSACNYFPIWTSDDWIV